MPEPKTPGESVVNNFSKAKNLEARAAEHDILLYAYCSARAPSVVISDCASNLLRAERDVEIRHRKILTCKRIQPLE
jgi:hypothetical protein